MGKKISDGRLGAFCGLCRNHMHLCTKSFRKKNVSEKFFITYYYIFLVSTRVHIICIKKYVSKVPKCTSVSCNFNDYTRFLGVHLYNIVMKHCYPRIYIAEIKSKIIKLQREIGMDKILLYHIFFGKMSR